MITQFAKHRWIEDLQYFEGPLLSLLTDETSQYFYYWLSRSSANSNLWLVFEVTPSMLSLYKRGEVSLQHILIALNTYAYVVEISTGFDIVSVKRNSTSDLWDKIPVGSYYDPDLKPPID